MNAKNVIRQMIEHTLKVILFSKKEELGMNNTSSQLIFGSYTDSLCYHEASSVILQGNDYLKVINRKT